MATTDTRSQCMVFMRRLNHFIVPWALLPQETNMCVLDQIEDIADEDKQREERKLANFLLSNRKKIFEKMHPMEPCTFLTFFIVNLVHGLKFL